MKPSEPEGAFGRQSTQDQASGISMNSTARGVLHEFEDLEISAFRCNQMGIGCDLSESG